MIAHDEADICSAHRLKLTRTCAAHLLLLLCIGCYIALAAAVFAAAAAALAAAVLAAATLAAAAAGTLLH